MQVDIKLLSAIYNYLVTRPYVEVHPLVKDLEPVLKAALKPQPRRQTDAILMAEDVLPMEQK